MIKEIQFQRRKRTIYAMDEDYKVVGQWECRDEFVHGYNSDGDPRGSLPNGLYTHVHAEVTNGAGRDIHGGGSGLPDPYADYQGWVPTYGCLRMQNADDVELSRMIIESGNDVELTVVEGY